MKFYQLKEITEGEYYAMTGDTDYMTCYQSTMAVGNDIYIAVDEGEEELEIDMTVLYEVQDER